MCTALTVTHVYVQDCIILPVVMTTMSLYVQQDACMESRGFAHLVAPGLVSKMLRCMIVKLVELVDLIGMRETDCFGTTRLVPHVPSSS